MSRQFTVRPGFGGLMAKGQVSAFVDRSTLEELRLITKERGVSLGMVAGQYLEHGFRSGMADNQLGIIVPTLEHFIGKLLRSELQRSSYFLVRLLIEVNALRRQVYAVHLDAGGRDKDKARLAFDRSYENAVKALKRRLPEVEVLVAELAVLETASRGEGGS